MRTLYSEVRGVVNELFPKATLQERLIIEEDIHEIIEGKDIGRFKGQISSFKQTAIDTADAMPRPVVTRRGIEKKAGKGLDLLVSRLERDMNLHLSRFRSDDSSRKISKTQFIKRMKSSMRVAYKDAYMLGTEASGLGRARAGLVTHSSSEEKQWLDNMFSQEQKYFNKFLDALIKGESKKKAQVRIGNYANAVRSIYESSRVLQLPDESIIHWVLQSRNPCPDCRMLHRLSPFTKSTLPTTPKSGSTRCLSWCFCKLRVVKSKPGEVERVARRNKSAKHILNKLRQNRKRA